MKLPSMKFTDGIRKLQQVKFAGLHPVPEAADGELIDMKNLTSDHYPALAVRSPRHLLHTLQDGGGIYDWNGLAWVDGTDFFYKGEKKGTVTAGKKQFAGIGPYIVIMPDKCWYNTESGEFGSMESQWTGGALQFADGILYEESATANTIVAEGTDWNDYFRVGDAVEIAGCTKHPENNKSIIIRAIDGEKLYFYEYSFTLEEGENYIEEGQLTISRKVPDLKYLCENENRLWGCDDETIYASKPGDVYNWNVFDGLETDSWAVTPGSAGPFTGCISYRGFPVFFKENIIYKVYGSLPSEFQCMGSATLGLKEGSAGSLAVAAETLFYLSNSGIMAYTGGMPQPIGEVFGTKRFAKAIAGSDGLKYYASMTDTAGDTFLYVYDTQRGLWHKEDDSRVIAFVRSGGILHCLNDRGEVWTVGTVPVAPEESAAEKPIAWEAEFADFTEDSPNKKGISKIQIRLELEQGSSVKVWLQTDSDGVWRLITELRCSGKKRSYYLPVVPRRCDHYRLKLTGTGAAKIYSITREIYAGSELKSKTGRN